MGHTKTSKSPAHITSGFYKIEAGPERPASYNFEETKYVLNGQVLIRTKDRRNNFRYKMGHTKTSI
jgi:uncharacterized cupin superfamily protein